MVQGLELTKRLGYSQLHDVRKVIKRLFDKWALEHDQVRDTASRLLSQSGYAPRWRKLLAAGVRQ